jgi:hypothetical protein
MTPGTSTKGVGVPEVLSLGIQLIRSLDGHASADAARA